MIFLFIAIRLKNSHFSLHFSLVVCIWVTILMRATSRVHLGHACIFIFQMFDLSRLTFDGGGIFGIKLVWWSIEKLRALKCFISDGIMVRISSNPYFVCLNQLFKFIFDVVFLQEWIESILSLVPSAPWEIFYKLAPIRAMFEIEIHQLEVFFAWPGLPLDIWM